jgi:hypothetical protein
MMGKRSVRKPTTNQPRQPQAGDTVYHKPTGRWLPVFDNTAPQGWVRLHDDDDTVFIAGMDEIGRVIPRGTDRRRRKHGR